MNLLMRAWDKRKIDWEILVKEMSDLDNKELKKTIVIISKTSIRVKVKLKSKLVQLYLGFHPLTTSYFTIYIL